MTLTQPSPTPTTGSFEPLIHPHSYIAGEWTDGESDQSFPVTDPATGQQLAQLPRLGAMDTRRAIQAAHEAGPPWRYTSADRRAAILRRWSELMHDHQQQLAELLVCEQGKPLPEALTEIDYAASFLEWFSEEGKRACGETIPATGSDSRILVLKQPIGVGAAITPWNFPAAMVTRKAAPALAAGCTLVLKPAEQTPLSATAICALGERAGLPPGVFNIVTGSAADAPVIGNELTTNPLVRKLSFTGSTQVGALLMQQAATTIKNVSLELGGNAPFLVFSDADLDTAVAGAMTAKFRNAGQTCISANRILVAEEVHDEFLTRLSQQAAALRVGHGLEDGVHIGPLIDQAAVAKVERHLADARRRGATVVLGGTRHPRGGTFFEPTVVTDVTPGMLACREETFGPIAMVQRFGSEAEAVTLANDSPYGLAAYLYTQDASRVWRVSEALEAGIVGVNTASVSTPVAPFGGVKQSGIGREGSRHGLDDWLELKYVCQAVLR